MITYHINRAYKSEMRVPISTALQYAEQVAGEKIERIQAGKIPRVQWEDPILATLSKRLNDLTAGTATNEEVIQFIHLTECISRTDFVQWLDSNATT